MRNYADDLARENGSVLELGKTFLPKLYGMLLKRHKKVTKSVLKYFSYQRGISGRNERVNNLL